MEINERIKEIRKNNKLSQTSFGEKIGVSRSVISNIEYNLVEPSDLIIKSICSHYGIFEKWLRTGNGNMLVFGDKDNYIEEISKQYNLNKNTQKLLKNYLSLSEEYKKVIDKLLDFFVQSDDITQNHSIVSQYNLNRKENEPKKMVKIYRAARSLNNKEDEIIEISQSVIEQLKKAPKIKDEF